MALKAAEQGLTYARIGDLIGRSEAAVSVQLHKMGYSRSTEATQEDDEYITRLYHEGHTDKQISIEMDWPIDKVKGRRKRLGLRRDGKFRRKTTKTKRKCLKCGIMFKSEWEGNRICPSCTEKNRAVPEVMDRLDIYGSRSGRGGKSAIRTP